MSSPQPPPDGAAAAAAAASETTVGDALDSREAGGKIIRGGGLRTGGYVLGILAGLISTPLLIQHLSEGEFGSYVAINSLIFVVTGLMEGGLAAIAVGRFAAGDAGERKALMENLLGLRIALLLVATAGAIGFAWAVGYNGTLIAGTAISCVGLAFSVANGIVQVPLTARLRQGALSALDLSRQLLIAAATVLLVAFGAGLLSFFAATAVAGAVIAVVALTIGRADVPLRPRIDRAAWMDLLRASVPYGIAAAFSVLYFRVGVIMVSIVSTKEEGDYYGLAFRVVEIATGVPYLLVFAAFPLLARAAGTNDDVRLSYALQRMFEVALLLGVLAAVGIGLGAPFAADILGGDARYDAAITPLVVLGTALIGTFLVSTWSYALLTLGQNRTLIVLNFGAVAVGTTGTAILASTHGATGAAIATAGTEIGLGIAYGIALSRTRPDLRPRLTVVPKVALAAAVAVAAPLLLGLPSLLATALGALLFAGVALATGAVPAEIRQAVASRGR